MGPALFRACSGEHAAVKRTRRVIVTIEQESISITKTSLRSTGPVSAPGQYTCSICAAPCVRVTPEVLAILIKKALHEYVVVRGELWVCSQLLAAKES